MFPGISTNLHQFTLLSTAYEDSNSHIPSQTCNSPLKKKKISHSHE